MKRALVLLLLLISLTGFGQNQPDHHEYKFVSRVAFGSCAWQDTTQPILNVIANTNPDLFIYLGDNIYGDSKVADTLRAKYQRLAGKPEFQNLKNKTTLLATWDDHDYGWNDAGRHYPLKDTSKKIFLNFWEEPKSSPRWSRSGIYTSYIYEQEGKKLQVILLDTRTFRDNLKYAAVADQHDSIGYHLDYVPYKTSDSTLLGEEQWMWLERQLQVEADLRIIGSSTQFGISYNGYEAWANFPHERVKMLDLIEKTKANGVIFISGDVHYGELSMLSRKPVYPIYDLTSSGITQTWWFATPNKNRVQGPVMRNNYGMILIDWEKEVIRLQIHTAEEKKIDKKVRFKELRLRK